MIERILDRTTIQPMNGYTDAELLQQHLEQREIMTYHEDYEALRGKMIVDSLIDAPNSKKGKKQLEKAKATSLTKTVQMCKPID